MTSPIYILKTGGWKATILIAILSKFALSQSPVRIWEESITIPTYLVGEAECNPMFYHGRAYQGARGPIYPYPLLDKLTNQREDKVYKALYLENDYVQICVLPEIGGRIFSAKDKTNGYDFFYRQHVIKPALIGMLGAWISGGVEWNVPHHHRASTFMTVDHILSENSNGSKTIWIGEMELRHRMRWLIGLTLYPGKSYLEAEVKIFNRTPLAHSILYFANVAVHANPEYQVIFPPGTEFATYHGKNQFSRWPIADSIFSGIDYTGVDVSWWKNHPSPVSFFAWNYEDDFLAGYDHGKQAGVVHVGDHHIIPGKKFFTWGNGPQNEMWNKILTDNDGSYLELMVGAYSDNQPDYSWCQPYETKRFKQYWYPIRQIQSVKNANLDAAVNLEVTSENVIQIGFNTTKRYHQARMVLKTANKNFIDQIIDIDPGNPFYSEFALPSDVKETELEVTLFSPDNKVLINYSPVEKEKRDKPKPVQPPPPPEDIETIEELYLTGLRLEQFYNPALEPDPYYQEALNRDPGDYHCNTALGILYCKRGRFQEAEKKLNQAIKRVTKNYTSPKDGEAYYYLGVALKAQGKSTAAYDTFYKATWSSAWQAASYFSLAELACLKGDSVKSLDLVEKSIAANTWNSKALNLKSVMLRKLGRYSEAERISSNILTKDPLDFWAANELYLSKLESGLMEQARRERSVLQTKMRNEVQSYIELALDYGNCGLWDEAIDILVRLVDTGGGSSVRFPLIYYYLGYYWDQKGAPDKASHYYKLAGEMPPDYCFPFRWETLLVLKQAMSLNPNDARPPFYLGNLLYDYQPDRAIKMWEQSRLLDDTFSITHRNLGIAYARRENDVEKAIHALEKAMACNDKDPRLYFELDQLYEAGGIAPEKRLALLKKNQSTVKLYDDALAREINLQVQLGYYDQAIKSLKGHVFHIWEGGGNIHNVYVDAHLLRGKIKFNQGKFTEALEDFNTALEYPDNLQVGKPMNGGRASQIYYFIGLAFESLGEIKNARASYENAVSEKHSWSEILYYQGLALKKLGRAGEATQIFDGLIHFARKKLESGAGMDFFAKFGEKQSEMVRQANAHYLLGLGYLGKGLKSKARVEFERVLQLNINHLGAENQLAEL